MVEPQTSSQVLKRLEDQGYIEDFRTHGKMLRMVKQKKDIAPENIIVDKIYRFEGETCLDDEEMIFALRCIDTNIKGTFIVAFGHMMDAQDAEMVQRLEKRSKK